VHFRQGLSNHQMAGDLFKSDFGLHPNSGRFFSLSFGFKYYDFTIINKQQCIEFVDI
jgi:hypothetical protein